MKTKRSDTPIRVPMMGKRIVHSVPEEYDVVNAYPCLCCAGGTTLKVCRQKLVAKTDILTVGCEVCGQGYEFHFDVSSLPHFQSNAKDE